MENIINFLYLYFMISIFILMLFTSYDLGHNGLVLYDVNTNDALKTDTKKDRLRANGIKIIISLLWGVIVINRLLNLRRKTNERK